MKSSYTFGVVGHRISYSRSPELFQAIADIKNFTCRFVLHDIDPENFNTSFPDVLKSGIDGFSVTIPHKTRIISHISDVDSTAEMLGAVNSVGVRQGVAHGFNTDGHGFAVPLGEYRSMLQGSTAIVVGAGGAAKAVVHCLTNDLGVKTIIVLGRNKSRIDTFADFMRRCCNDADLRTLPLTECDRIHDEDYSIVVNCTPLGGWNHPDESPFPDGFVWRTGRLYYDLSYNDDNRLVRQTTERGMTAFDGSAMLIGQAIRSFYLWTGQTVDFAPVFESVFGRR